MTTFCRFYHVSAAVYSISIKKQGLKLCKMINPKNKKQWYPSHTMENDLLPSVKSLAKVKYEPGKRSIRRLAMLNKLFMKQITDIMSTGTVAMDVVGRGIEISKAKVTPDLQAVNVYWVCKGTSSDEETEAVLNRIAGPLRHELSTLRVMGEVPYIMFVKDVQESQVAELDRRLSVADYGEDYTPTDIGQLIKDEFTLHTKLSPEMKAKIKQLEDESPILEEPIPEMTHNIYGLEHAKIMNRLLAARKKSKDAWTNLEADNTVISYRTPEYTVPEPDVDEQKQQLAEFLLKRQLTTRALDDWRTHQIAPWPEELDADEELPLDPEDRDANRAGNPESNCSDIDSFHETDTEQYSDETVDTELPEPRERIPFYTGKDESTKWFIRKPILQNKLSKQLRDSRDDWQLAPDDIDEEQASYGEDEDDEYSDDDDYYDQMRFQPENTQEKPQV